MRGECGRQCGEGGGCLRRNRSVRSQPKRRRRHQLDAHRLRGSAASDAQRECALAVDFVIGGAGLLPLFLPKSGRRSVVFSVALGIPDRVASLLTDRWAQRHAGFAPVRASKRSSIRMYRAQTTCEVISNRAPRRTVRSTHPVSMQTGGRTFFGARGLEPSRMAKMATSGTRSRPRSARSGRSASAASWGKCYSDYLCAMRSGKRDQLRAHLNTGISVVHHYRVPQRGSDNELFLTAIGATIIA